MIDLQKRFAVVVRSPNLFFVVTFFLLNLLLFLPFYLFNPDSISLLPPTNSFDQGFWIGINRLFVWRSNLDPLRISFEFTLLVALWVTLPRLRGLTLRVGIAGLYLLMLAYAIYEALMLALFLTQPDFYSQYFWARDGLPFLASHIETSWWLLLLGLAGLIAVLALLLTLIRILLQSSASPNLASGLRMGSVILAGLCLLSVSRYQIWSADAEMVVSSFAFKLDKNINASLQRYADVASFDDRPIRAAYDYSRYHLTQKPNIYLIFVESYGSVLYKRPDYQKSYERLLGELEGRLQDAGWSSATNLSESPMWGGGSWMAYTSALFGLRIDNQPGYLSLFNKYQVNEYPGLGRTLKAQGYRYIWLSSISNELNEQDWLEQQRFHGVDQFLRFQDLHYQGAGYGWGPSPPDQYVLNYVQKNYLGAVEQPLFFTTITQNSHYPWIPQPEMVDDWQTLNQPPDNTGFKAESDPEAIDHSIRRQNYWRAVDYQLRVLIDFVLHSEDENALFVLVGDHQPPRVSRREDGWTTPIHVLSRDPKLIALFDEYGFEPGLQVDSYETKLHHEGIYSLLMRVLLEHDGVAHTALPDYLPSGVVK